jgi:hypothetical protein
MSNDSLIVALAGNNLPPAVRQGVLHHLAVRGVPVEDVINVLRDATESEQYQYASGHFEPSIPEAAFQATWAECGLRRVPPQIGLFVNLEALHLDKNFLTVLSPELVQLRKLTKLVVSDNQLVELPDDPEFWAQMRNLYVNNNQLTKLPEALIYATNLQRLYAENNPLDPSNAPLIHTLRARGVDVRV